MGKNQKIKYVLTDILHSGRKGLRNMPVTDPKYDGMPKSIITLSNVSRLEDYKQFQELEFDFIETTSGYDWWHTSAIIAIGKDTEGGYVVETVNAIYYMKEVEVE